MAYDMVIQRRPAAWLAPSHGHRHSKGRIASVAPGLVADSAEVIDAAGRFVVPGFVDSHFPHR